MEGLDIALKGIKAVFIYNMLREGVPKANAIWKKRIQVVVTSGVSFRVVAVIDIFTNTAPTAVSVKVSITTTGQSSLAALLFKISLLKYYLSEKFK